MAAITPTTLVTAPACRMVHGTYTGDGSGTVTLNLGASPIWGKVWNYTDGDVQWDYYKGMAAGYALTHNITATAEHGVITSNGFTIVAGTYSAGAGITMGSAMTESAKVFHFFFVLP